MVRQLAPLPSLIGLPDRSVAVLIGWRYPVAKVLAPQGEAGDPGGATVGRDRDRARAERAWPTCANAFAAILNLSQADLPPGALDPFVDHVANTLAELVDRLPTPAATSIDPTTGDRTPAHNDS
jgi:hypothetical protein